MSPSRTSIEDILKNAPNYMDVVSAYDLDVAESDWQVDETGGLDMTLDGNPKSGDDRTNAMHRLILRWCSNAPILNVLFSMAAHSNATTQRLNTEKDVIAPLVFQNRQSMERYHDIDNEMVAHTFGGGACAGAMMVVLNNDLMRYKDDFKQLPTSGKPVPRRSRVARSDQSLRRPLLTFATTMNGREPIRQKVCNWSPLES